MGTSLHLNVECKTDTGWEFVETDVSHPGGYDMMGCLFGIRNHCNFEPIVPPDRGIPDDASDQFDPLRDNDEFLTTWVGLDEIEAVDWNEYANSRDSRVSFYDENGNYVKKVGAFSVPCEEDGDYMGRVNNGEEVTLTLATDWFEFDAGDEVTLVREWRQRKDVKNDGWEENFEILRRLAGEYGGPEDVRMIAIAVG